MSGKMPRLALALDMRSGGAMALLHYDLTETIIGVFYDVYNETGANFLEKVVQTATAIALRSAGLTVVERRSFPVFFRGELIGEFWPDLVVNDLVLVEIKSKNSLIGQDEAQLINYLRVSSLEVGLVLNFGARPQVMRRILTNDLKARRGVPPPVDSKILSS
jgi:GxxExxY protein